MKSGHVIEFKIDWATPVLMVAIGAIFIIITAKVFDE